MEARNTLKTILRVDALPTLPDVIHHILEITGDPMSSMKELAAVIERDPALSANMLKLVNSAYFGFSRQITAIRDAGVLLGYGAIRAMALGTSVVGAINTEHFDCYKFWAHSLSSAVATNVLARELEHPNRDQAFIAGLLHDVGVLLLAVSFPDLGPTTMMAEEAGAPTAEREKIIFGVTHDVAGGHLARHWRFDALLTRAIEEHHIVPGGDVAQMSPLGRLVWLGEWMLGDHHRLPFEYAITDEQAAEVARSLGYPLDMVRKAEKAIDKELGIVEPLLSSGRGRVMTMHDRQAPDPPLDPAVAEAAGLFRAKLGELSLVRELANCGAYLDDLPTVCNAMTGAIQNTLQIDACALFGADGGEGWSLLGGVSLDPVAVPPDRVAPGLLDMACSAADGVARTGHDGLTGVPPQLAVALSQGRRRAGVLVFTDADAVAIWERRQDLMAIVTRMVATLADAAQMWRKVEDANRYLEVTLEQRTQALKESQERLHQQEKLASLGQLLTGVSHELNNRLVPVLGYAQLLKGRDLDGALRPAVDAIESAALGSKRIVDDMLSFARPATPQYDQVDIGDLLRQVAANVTVAHGEPCPLKVHVLPNVPAVRVDRQQMEQVFHNLIKNGLEAIADRRDGNVRVTVAGDAGRVAITIEDNGSGIPDDVVSRIFEPFFSTKAVGKGTGLGLSITHGLTRANGGTIRVESRNGIGTRFVVSLPTWTAKDAENAASTAKAAPEKHKASHSIKKSTGFIKKRLLVVDDESGIREFLSQALDREFDVKTADNGVDAQAVLASEVFDVVLMDLRMPGLTGVDLYRWLRAERPEQADAVVFMTGDTYDPETSVFLEGRKNPHLRKPFTLSQLRGALGDD